MLKFETIGFDFTKSLTFGRAVCNAAIFFFV